MVINGLDAGIEAMTLVLSESTIPNHLSLAIFIALLTSVLMIEMYPFVSKFKRGKFLYLALTKYKHIDLVYLAISADFFVGNVYY